MYIIYSGNKSDQLAAHRVCIGLGRSCDCIFSDRYGKVYDLIRVLCIMQIIVLHFAK